MKYYSNNGILDNLVLVMMIFKPLFTRSREVLALTQINIFEIFFEKWKILAPWEWAPSICTIFHHILHQCVKCRMVDYTLHQSHNGPPKQSSNPISKYALSNCMIRFVLAVDCKKHLLTCFWTLQTNWIVKWVRHGFQTKVSVVCEFQY